MSAISLHEREDHLSPAQDTIQSTQVWRKLKNNKGGMIGLFIVFIFLPSPFIEYEI